MTDKTPIQKAAQALRKEALMRQNGHLFQQVSGDIPDAALERLAKVAIQAYQNAMLPSREAVSRIHARAAWAEFDQAKRSPPDNWHGWVQADAILAKEKRARERVFETLNG